MGVVWFIQKVLAASKLQKVSSVQDLPTSEVRETDCLF